MKKLFYNLQLFFVLGEQTWEASVYVDPSVTCHYFALILKWQSLKNSIPFYALKFCLVNLLKDLKGNQHVL